MRGAEGLRAHWGIAQVMLCNCAACAHACAKRVMFMHAWLRRTPLPGRVDLRCPLVVGGVDMLQPGRRKPAAFSAPSAASRVTRLRGQKWLSKGACSHSQPQSSTEERRKTAGPPQKPPWIHRQGPSAWCRTGGTTARSPRRLRKSLTSNHARS